MAVAKSMSPSAASPAAGGRSETISPSAMAKKTTTEMNSDVTIFHTVFQRIFTFS
jgi:hypothetical protein